MPRQEVYEVFRAFQIPKSYAVNGQCEPCYTSPLQNAKRTPNIPIYSNLMTSQAEIGIVYELFIRWLGCQNDIILISFLVEKVLNLV